MFFPRRELNCEITQKRFNKKKTNLVWKKAQCLKIINKTSAKQKSPLEINFLKVKKQLFFCTKLIGELTVWVAILLLFFLHFPFDMSFYYYFSRKETIFWRFSRENRDDTKMKNQNKSEMGKKFSDDFFFQRE